MNESTPRGPLWGPQTDAAVANFRISGRTMPAALIHWLARLKSAAAQVNANLGRLDGDIAVAIGRAADDIAAGRHDDQFPVDVYQTGSGTSTNMNVNEVIASLTGGIADPYDHVNLGQSSNDVVPTAARLAACDLIGTSLVPAMEHLAGALRERAEAFADVVKPGRTHLMDAVPVTLGDEFAAHAAQLDESGEHLASALPHLARVPLGGTAVGNGLGTDPTFGERVLESVDADGRLRVRPSVATSRLALQGAHDSFVATSGALNVVATALVKVCNDLRWMASGPDAGLGEIRMPALQKGSSIMPGKTNPVICEAVIQVAARVIGNHTTITFAGTQGNFELNVTIPVITDALVESIDLLAAACRSLADDCVAGLEADAERCRSLAERDLAIATALTPLLGYAGVERIVDEARATGRSIHELAVDAGLDRSDVDRRLDLERIARGGR